MMGLVRDWEAEVEFRDERITELEHENAELAEYIADTYEAHTTQCPCCGVEKPMHNGICRIAKFRAAGKIPPERAAREAE